MKDEREDLVETYRDMSTEELLDHWESGTLTELAIQTASAELVRRGVAVPPVKRIEDEVDDREPKEETAFVTIARSFTPTEMHILRARLEADGIPAFVVDDNINQTNLLLSVATGGVRLQVAGQFAGEARRIVDEVKSGERALDHVEPDAAAPESPTLEEAAEPPSPTWEFLLTGAVFTFASFEFVKTMWFARTFNTDIEWNTVSFLALALPILYFVGALLLAFRSKWAILCFATHLPFSIGSAFLLTPDEPIQANQVIGWICTVGIVYFCIHLRRQGRMT